MPAAPAAAAGLPGGLAWPARPQAPAGCGLFSIGCQAGHAVDSWFTSLATSASNPLFGLLGRALLSTPQLGDLAAVRSLQAGSLALADAAYVLLVLAGGMVVMSHQSLQTSYAARDIAPRLVVGFLAANLSLPLAGKMISLADGLSAALAGQGLHPAPAGMLRSLTERVLAGGGTFFILLALAAVGLVLMLTVIYVARLMLTVVLLAVAPLALACHALPHTEGVARWWWRAFTGILLIQAAQAIVLVAAARLFFTPQWASLIASEPGGPGAGLDAVQLLCLLYILVRIPFWIGRRVWAGGRSPLRSAARFVFAAAVLRRVTPALSGRTTRRPGRARGRSGPQSP